MKSLNKIIMWTALALLVFTVGCSKDFLDEKPTKSLTAERLAEIAPLNPSALAGGVEGIYSLTFQYGVGGWGGHDDFGQKSFDIMSGIVCGDIAQLSHAYNKFTGASNLQGLTRSGADSYKIWRYYYKIIKEANGFIETFNDQMPEKKEAKYTYGQVKALRAYAYLYLVNFLANPYSVAKDDKAIVLTLKNDDIAKPLSTVQEVYDVIISDLETAVEALEGFDRANKSSINQNVARGFLAYAYLFTENYAKAEETANAVIASGEFELMSKKEVFQSGFNNVNISGWMWAFDLTTDNTAMLPTFWGMMDYFTYGYSSVTGWAISNKLYAQIPNSDVRKKQFEKKFKYRPTHKFFDAGRIPDGDRTWTNDEVYMRVAEMYLAKAEAQARQGKDVEAQKTLKILVKERDTDAGRIDSETGEDLLDEIYLQWRIEMWGEGKTLWAMKRFQKTNARGDNSFLFPGVEFAYNDPQIIVQIPDVELNANPEIQ
ncbi:MAG: RagB/SusD family nutrient uptake outer membrane protein [Bacteroidia bacterium]|nr:MAG: RagB/SusD family nutrient uptake outer membrane protein [Bacteroidia bacterium]